MGDLKYDKDNFRQLLLNWYRSAQRPLPWRAVSSTYKTVVSEFMLQQTQVKTMLPYFERWLARFADFEALANASAEDVLRHWEGLGYYSRARNLHKLAKAYVAMDPKPTTAEEWQALPGIGPYTAAAVSSIANGYPAAVVDGNVVRILARLTGEMRAFKSNGAAVAAFKKCADELLNRENPGDHNQAMMELGATVCMRQKPLCTVCPVLQFCSGAAQGIAEKIPIIQRTATLKVEVDRLWAIHEGKILLHRIPDTAKQLAGQYELPMANQFRDLPELGQPIAIKSRGITNKRIREKIYRVQPENITIHAEELHWIALNQLDGITLSGPHRRWINEFLSQESAMESGD